MTNKEIIKQFRCIYLALLLPILAYAQNETLLPAEQAFHFSADTPHFSMIRARWNIAEGYYMYKDKMEAWLVGPKNIALPINLPQGKKKEDPLFGEVEVYSDHLDIPIPAALISSITSDSPFSITFKGQGCNEPIGVCYPPLSHTQAFFIKNEPNSKKTDSNTKLRKLVAPENTLPALNSTQQLKGLFTLPSEEAFLDADQAFKLRLKRQENGHLTAIFDVADGYYLYKEKMTFTSEPKNYLQFISQPSGKLKQDAYLGEVEIYQGMIALNLAVNTHQSNYKILASYQGCATDGICYSPVNKIFTHTNIEPATTGQSNLITKATNTDKIPASSWINKLKNLIAPNSSTHDWKLLIGAFLGGLLLTLTPCVLPMVPIVSGIIAGQGKNANKTKGSFLAMIYVLGTITTYSAMGYLAGKTGFHLQSYFQNIWAVGILSTILILLGLSLFGLYKIQVPNLLQTTIQNKTEYLGGSYFLTFFLGIFSALIIGACVSPVFISFLSFSISKSDPWLGAKIMALMAFGMGVPLILMGLGMGHVLPKTGQWMESVNHFFGAILIGMGIYILSTLNVMPILLLWGGYLIFISIFLGAFDKLNSTSTLNKKLRKGVGIALLVWGILCLTGAGMGGKDVLHPLPKALLQTKNETLNVAENTQPFEFIKISTPEQLHFQLDKARTLQKAVFIDYYADWCVDCIRMEETTFAAPDIKKILREKFIAVQINVTDPNNKDGQTLKNLFSVFGPPATIIVDAQGNVDKSRSFYGYKSSAELGDLLADG